MIDGYYKEERLLEAGHDEFWLATRNNSQLSSIFYDEIGEGEIIQAVKDNGESDGVSMVIYLSNLNNTIHIQDKTGVCTDVVAAFVGDDNKLSIWVANADDTNWMYVSLSDLPWGVVDAIYDQAMEKYHI